MKFYIMPIKDRKYLLSCGESGLPVLGTRSPLRTIPLSIPDD